MLIYRNSFQYISKRNRGYLLRGHIHGIYPSIRFSRFPEGFSPSHFLFAEFFCEIPTLFQKIFCAGFRKQKSAHCACLVGVVSAKNKTR